MEEDEKIIFNFLSNCSEDDLVEITHWDVCSDREESELLDIIRKIKKKRGI